RRRPGRRSRQSVAVRCVGPSFGFSANGHIMMARGPVARGRGPALLPTRTMTSTRKPSIRRATATRGRRSMPAGIWALGIVSLLMDVSSEMIHALLPVFLVGVLGASVTLVGVMEGAAEAIASMTKIVS